jgi:UDP:flavonoid glycosyltransferase YjiC (YdhE family)
VNVSVLAVGSRGDVQPFVALAHALQERGHRVRVAAAADYGDLVRENGVEFAPLVGRVFEMVDCETVYRTMDGGMANPFRLGRRFLATAGPLMSRLFADARDACADADLLVVTTLGQYAGHSVAEARGGIPVVATHFHPYTPSRHYAHMFFPDRGEGAHGYNRLTHRLGIGAFWHALRPVLNRAQRDVLGLPPLSAAGLNAFLRREARTGVHLHAYSAHLAPPYPDWDPARHAVTGPWPLPRPADWEPAADLAAFLADGPPPVYAGFGSILAGRDADGVTHAIIAALEQAGARGVLFRGWGDVGNVPLPPTVHATDGAYHDWLFPRCAAVVHHGGSGTTTAALRAGVPAVVLPVFGDQKFWAARLHALGASPVPLPRTELTAGRLAERLRAVLTDARYAERTREIGTAVRAEDGIGRAVRLIEKAGK